MRTVHPRHAHQVAPLQRRQILRMLLLRARELAVAQRRRCAQGTRRRPQSASCLPAHSSAEHAVREDAVHPPKRDGATLVHKVNTVCYNKIKREVKCCRPLSRDPLHIVSPSLVHACET